MFTFFDFETTDKIPVGAEILTGYFLTLDKNFKVIDDLYIEAKPDLYKWESFYIHEISKEQAMNFPEKKEALRKITQYIIKHIDDYFVCHANAMVYGVNGYFDWQVLRKEFLFYSDEAYFFFSKKFRNIKLMSTHTMAKNVLCQSKNDLATLCKQFNIKLDHHDCVSDTKATAELFKIFYQGDFSEDKNKWSGDFLN